MQRSQSGIQAQLVGLIDDKSKLERLLQACRGICGRTEQKLLHRETVYKLAYQSVQPNGSRGPNYELRYRLGKISTSEPDKPVQPMSLICIGDSIPLPKTCEKLFPPDTDVTRRISKPNLRKIVEVEVGSTCDEFMKLLGFEQDFVFIRSGHVFQCGSDDRCCIQISEIHKIQGSNQTPKFEVDRSGNPVDNLWLVEINVNCDETSPSVDSGIKMMISFCEKLSPYVSLSSPEERKAQS
mmetsp:Transcript_2042/g.5343  ORF Transcript_2042/g.5343 Transcript_2042/m.5343 type:complete len:239 (+) Transcript_2042:1-717(+)